jgi:hypothetical protein
MIYIRRDRNLIPDKVIAVAQKATNELEALSAEDRKDFIKKKSHIWKAFGRYLAKMSYGKCWYSESKDIQSFFDVDHFRPKSEARRAEEIVDAEGYAWLAFDWENFRFSSQRCNRVSKDEESDELVGKGSWFPLIDGSPKAVWSDRCINEEAPYLLDPARLDDVVNVDIAQDGRFSPLPHCIGLQAVRIRKTAKIYGLNLPRIKEARLKIIREVTRIHELIMKFSEALDRDNEGDPNDLIVQQITMLKEKTRADAQFCKAARSQLLRLPYGNHFIDLSKDGA